MMRITLRRKGKYEYVADCEVGHMTAPLRWPIVPIDGSEAPAVLGYDLWIGEYVVMRRGVSRPMTAYQAAALPPWIEQELRDALVTLSESDPTYWLSSRCAGARRWLAGQSQA